MRPRSKEGWRRADSDELPGLWCKEEMVPHPRLSGRCINRERRSQSRVREMKPGQPKKITRKQG